MIYESLPSISMHRSARYVTQHGLFDCPFIKKTKAQVPKKLVRKATPTKITLKQLLEGLKAA